MSLSIKQQDLLFEPGIVGTYVGQSVRLGRRVRSHAAGNEKSSKKRISIFTENARVIIYAVKKVPKNIDLQMFLTILEQYLFFVIRPTHNNFLVASSGFYNKESDKSRHIKAKPLYVYCFIKEKYFLLHTFNSISAICHLLNISAG